MRERTPVDIGLEFVEHINRTEHQQLCDMMTDDYTFIDITGGQHGPKREMVEGWREYMRRWPHYMIHISEAYNVGDAAVMPGRTVNSHLEIPREEEFADPLIFVARTRDGKVYQWHLLSETPENRRELGLTV